MSKAGANGKVCLYTSASTNLIVDANGYHPTTSRFVSLSPARVLETRRAATADGQYSNIGALTGEYAVVVAGRVSVPGVVEAVSLNVTVTGASGAGYLSVYPCGSRPNASNLNYEANQTIANSVTTKVAANGQICLFASTTTGVIIDVNGYFAA